MKKIIIIGLLIGLVILTGCIKTTTPLNKCTKYFDGCNTCMVVDGEVTGCTEMYCEVYEEPKCLESLY